MSPRTIRTRSQRSHQKAALQSPAGCGAPRAGGRCRHLSGLPCTEWLSRGCGRDPLRCGLGPHCVRRVDPDGTVTTLAGDGHASLTETGLSSPCGLCVCNLPGRGPVLLIADRSNSCVRLLPVDACHHP